MEKGHDWYLRGGEKRCMQGKREGKRPLGRPRHGWENYVKIDLQEVGWGT